nr:hypothetical protein [Bacteroidota bacterium]
MKRILIFSYYFPPCHGSAPWRAFSWAQHFKALGLFPVVVTRHWHGNEHSWADYVNDVDLPLQHEVTNDCEVYKLPSQKSSLFHFLHRRNLINKFLRPAYYFLSDIVGNFSPDVNAYKTFSAFASQYLESNNFDFILLTCPPHNLCKLIPELKQKSKAKIIADFRDIWDNFEPTPSYRPSFSKRITNSLYKLYLKKWMIHSYAVSTVTPAFVGALQKVSGKKVVVIYNGFEENYFENITRQPNDIFTCSMIGSLYAAQPVNIIIDGINLFLKQHPQAKAIFIFIGLDANNPFIKSISQAIDSKYLYFSPRLNKADAIKATVQSDVLLYPGWQGYKGIVGVKPLDYLASRNNILLAPGDGDILDKIIAETNAGVIANNAEDFANKLSKFYAEWSQDKKCVYNGIESKINFYTRRNQTAIFANYLLSLNNE